MSQKPTNEAEYSAMAHRLADTGAFDSAETIRYVLTVWPEETARWWNGALARRVDTRCRSLGAVLMRGVR